MCVGCAQVADSQQLLPGGPPHCDGGTQDPRILRRRKSLHRQVLGLTLLCQLVILDVRYYTLPCRRSCTCISTSALRKFSPTSVRLAEGSSAKALG